jgi:nucleoside-diphosphate-sugar epimerase
MKVFIAGGTGAIGRPLIAELLAKGHALVALTRSPEKAQALVEQGIEPAIADVNASGLWPGNVMTEVRPAGPFWEAEPEHRDYLLRNPGGYTCHYPRAEWKLPGRPSARTA